MKGYISIGRHDDHIRIEFVDVSSNVRFLVAHMGAADFARAITGSGQVELEFELFTKNVGKQQQSIEMPVKFDGTQKLDDVLAEYEVDGWTAMRQDIGNMHRHRGNNVWSVRFYRWV